MVLRMAAPVRRKTTSFLQFRKRIPADLRGRAGGTPLVVEFPAAGDEPASVVNASVGKSEVVFSLRTRDPVVAKARQAIALAAVDRAFNGLRIAAPTTLSHRDATALAGDVYRAITDALGDDPQIAEGVFYGGEGDALSIRTPEATERRVGGFTDWALARNGVVATDAASRAKVNDAVADLIARAGATLKRNAARDYSPDMVLPTLPSFTPPKATPTANPEVPRKAASKGLTWDALIATWEKVHEARRGPLPTRREWRALVTAFGKWSGVGPEAITEEHVRKWRDKRLAEGVSPVTVGGSDLAKIRGIFRVAIEERVFTGANPVQGVRVRGMSTAAANAGAFSDDAAAAILTAAKRDKTPYRRWVPWLCAFTGSRVSSMMNLRACDVRTVDGFTVVEISADAGPVKTRVSERLVPIHPALVADGFLEFVAERRKLGAETRLFYTRRQAPSGLGTYNPGRRYCDRLSAWVRSLGLDVGRAHGKDPNHAWRHWIKRHLREASVPDSVSDAITGHAPRSEGAAYGGTSLKTMADAIAKLSVPKGR